jgi:hypothetical protein
MGAYAYARFQFVAYDDRTGALLDNTVWESTDAVQTATLIIPITPAPGDGIDFRVDFEAGAYTSSFNYGSVDGPLFVYADYSHSLDYFVTGGGGLIGASGHDYALDPVAGVPEPSAWALISLGVGALGGFARVRGRGSRRLGSVTTEVRLR